MLLTCFIVSAFQYNPSEMIYHPLVVKLAYGAEDISSACTCIARPSSVSANVNYYRRRIAPLAVRVDWYQVWPFLAVSKPTFSPRNKYIPRCGHDSRGLLPSRKQCFAAERSLVQLNLIAMEKTREGSRGAAMGTGMGRARKNQARGMLSIMQKFVSDSSNRTRNIIHPRHSLAPHRRLADSPCEPTGSLSSFSTALLD